MNGRSAAWLVIASSAMGCGASVRPSELRVASPLASRCAGVRCGAGDLVCDPLDGRCKPDGRATRVGARCTKSGPTSQCGNRLGVWCNSEPDEGFPGGYCSYEPCSEARPCPIGSSCVRLGGMPPACFVSCAGDGDCRAPDYRCVDGEQLYVAGPSRRVCYLPAFSCFKDTDCPESAPRCQEAAREHTGDCAGR